jgi:shikimate kinase
LPSTSFAVLYPELGSVSTFGQVRGADVSPVTPSAEETASTLGSSRLARNLDRSIVLVGMMGAGKTAIGRRLAAELGWPFADADVEIEIAAGTSIANIFAEIGEAAFRQSERQVIARLVNGPCQVLALGGGAFMDPQTRALVKERTLSIWLRAHLDTLVERTSRRQNRPLLRGVDPRTKLAALLEERAPVYAQADLIVDSDQGRVGGVVATILERLEQHGNEAGGERA